LGLLIERKKINRIVAEIKQFSGSKPAGILEEESAFF
jgi:hypothetical protein